MKTRIFFGTLFICLSFLIACGGQKDDSWRSEYAAYVRDMLKESGDYSSFEFALLYVDDDEIPELFFSSGYSAGGENIMTYCDGRVISQNLSRVNSSYFIERAGLILNKSGNTGIYPVCVYKLENGVFHIIGEGRSYEKGMFGGEYPVDENGERTNELVYEWQGEEVTKDEYEAHIDTLFDQEAGFCPHEGELYTYEEMMEFLETGMGPG